MFEASSARTITAGQFGVEESSSVSHVAHLGRCKWRSSDISILARALQAGLPGLAEQKGPHSILAGGDQFSSLFVPLFGSYSKP